MNRRQFLVATSSTTIIMLGDGCTSPSQATLIADANAVAEALKGLGVVLSKQYPVIAGDLSTAAAGIAAAVANWTGTTLVSKLNAAAAGAEVVLMAIPLPATQLVAALLPIAVAALDVLIANTQTKGPVAVAAISPSPAMMKVMADAKMYQKRNWRGKVEFHGAHPQFISTVHSQATDFKETWNEIAKANPTLGEAVIK